MVIKALADDFVPYASANSVIQVIKQYRDRGLQEPLTQTGLEQIGAPTSMASFTLRTLAFLGLMDEGGYFTTDFRRIRQANTTEYPAVLEEIIRKAYVRVFNIVDPAKQDVTSIVDAFRIFEPSKQRDKMVALFMGLCEEANIVPAGKAKRRNTTAGTSGPRRSSEPKGAKEPLDPPEAQPQTPPTPNAQREVVELASGGTITVILNANMWRMSNDDEKFILDLVHRIREYNAEHSQGQDVSNQPSVPSDETVFNSKESDS